MAPNVPATNTHPDTNTGSDTIANANAVPGFAVAPAANTDITSNHPALSKATVMLAAHAAHNPPNNGTAACRNTPQFLQTNTTHIHNVPPASPMRPCAATP